MTDLAVAHHELRPLMFSIAYRMLGSVAEAEDIVQEAFLRIHKAVDAGEVLEVPRGLRHHGDDATDPAHRLELDDTVSTAFLVVLERLSPVERAVFLLREVFGYGYDEIAEVVQKSEANCRQLFARAKSHLDDERPRFDPSPEHRAELAARFFAALHDGDVKGLERLLADDVMFYADGGGKVPAIAKPLRGVLRVVRFLLGLMRIRARATGRLIPVEANGHPAARLELAAGELVGVMMLDIADGRIQAIRNQLNPDKLHHLGQVGDIRALVSGTDTSPPE
jgi:DNA-directed RNA polymerase specialized sigma24 family protein